MARFSASSVSWSPCSTASTIGSINLNTLLACWPEKCLEYIVVHELAHLHEANHSPHFHAIVERYLPEWRERKNAALLFLDPDGRLELVSLLDKESSRTSMQTLG